MSSAFVPPAYGRRSLGDVIPAIAAALGADLGADLGVPPSDLELPSADRYVLFLVDGLGFELLERHAHEAPFLSSLMVGARPATVGVPTTTATSLTSLGTGLTPGTHGVVGFTSRIPGTEELLNALFWSKHVDPIEWQPHPTTFDHLHTAGVHATVVNKQEFQNSGLTLASTRGADFVGAEKWGERVAAVLASSQAAPSLTYMYDGDLDWTGHRYGVGSEQWAQQLAMIDAGAEHVRDVLPDDTRLLVVADHGMVDCPVEDRVDVDEHPDLRDGVVLLGGEARFRHVYCRAGAVDDVRETWSSFLGDRAVVLTRDEAVAKGWFGELTPHVRPRLGDVVVACSGTTAIMSSVDFSYEQSLIGMHGSLTSAEMLVPILLA